MKLRNNYILKNITKENKNILAIYNKVTCNGHRNSGSRFLFKYTWNHYYFNENNILHAMSKILKISNSNNVEFLIIDNTLSKKDISKKYIKDLNFDNSHIDRNKPI